MEAFTCQGIEWALINRVHKYRGTIKSRYMTPGRQRFNPLLTYNNPGPYHRAVVRIDGKDKRWVYLDGKWRVS